MIKTKKDTQEEIHILHLKVDEYRDQIISQANQIERMNNRIGYYNRKIQELQEKLVEKDRLLKMVKKWNVQYVRKKLTTPISVPK